MRRADLFTPGAARQIMQIFYPQIHTVHIWAIMLSGLWLAMRGAGLLAGMAWPRSVASWSVGLAIDGTLLTAAAMLFAILPEEVFANRWIVVKLICVAVYFGVGYYLLFTPLRRGMLGAMLLLAMLAYTLAYGIARTHDPAGWSALLL